MNERYTLHDRDTNELVSWTVKQILEDINRDRSEEWTDYDETDWREGLTEFTEWEVL